MGQDEMTLIRSGLLICSATAILTGCATPITTLQNPGTKQVVECGGERCGAMMGGMIGYNLQANDAADCVKKYSELGFEIINDKAD